MLALVAQRHAIVEMRAGHGDVVAQARAPAARIAKLSEIVFPADLPGERRGMAEIGRVHQFEILFVLRGGARGDFIEPFSESAAGWWRQILRSVSKK